VVWTGSNKSGNNSNITDVVIGSGVTRPLTYLAYNGAINGIILSITFNMSDGSSKTISGIGPL